MPLIEVEGIPLATGFIVTVIADVGLVDGIPGVAVGTGLIVIAGVGVDGVGFTVAGVAGVGLAGVGFAGVGFAGVVFTGVGFAGIVAGVIGVTGLVAGAVFAGGFPPVSLLAHAAVKTATTEINELDRRLVLMKFKLRLTGVESA